MKKVDVNKAKLLLEQGDVVAIPTETVYGLAGWIHSDEGLRKIFSTKERPFFDPLIVHVDSIAKAKILTSDWTLAHETLAQSCWPGPLTLIAKKHDSVNPLITAGLDSVGIRCPRHELTLKLLSEMEGGLAAPSANKFGKTSPTSAQHVYDEFKDQVAILDGGNSEVGIESTVAGIERLHGGFVVSIFRPGFYTAEMLSQIMKENSLKAEVKYAESPVAPGQLKHHYMPKIPLVIVPQGFDWNSQKNDIESKLNLNFRKPIVWKLPHDPQLASRTLYQNLREFDQQGYDLILISKESHHETEEWLGIWNRLGKAKSLALI